MELGVWRRFRSPLLLAFIFITILHNSHCRHKIRHYKDRFKRQQGAHLYLPESYVTDGGDGSDSGPWMEWSEPSPCSRTCGGGVSTQYRQCHDGYDCQGPTRRHFSCNTQDCPDTGDFRSQQCSEYDEVTFDNVKYQWVPYTKGPNPCELNCMPRGQRFYYRHAPVVVDGTRCSDTSLDVCVAGKCQPVGCDMMLGSTLKEDECRVCGGDGSTCHTISNTLELNDMKVGYNDILLIPGGATNILVEEVLPSSNYLAIRNTSGHYYLNGNWRVDFPSTRDFAGSKFHYEREPQGFDAPDIIYTLGPTDEPLFIVLLFQDSVVPVRYKYSLPTNIQPGSEHETYAWTFDEYTQCTSTCGGGVQHRNVSCAGRKTLEPVDETLCDAARKPETSRKCSEVACEAQWVPHPWGNCSVPCGEEGGVQTREISCQQIVSNGYPSLVDDFQCQGPKPPQQQKCNEGVTCATWHLGPWKPCDHLCGDGKQTRQVTCFIKNEQGRIQVLDDAQCEPIQPKPAVEQKCFNRPCEGVDWITSEWTGCDICGLANETRKIFCATAKGQIYGDELCDDQNKPEAVRQCESNDNEACVYLWYASQWSECSSKCGKGIQTRTLFCGLSTADGVKKVENDKCDQTRTFETMKNCTGSEECDGEWFSGPWGECSKPCGGGDRTKKVVCIKGNEVVDVSHCDSDKTTFSFEDCNKQECTGDELLPTDKHKPLTIPTDKETEATSEMSTTESTDKYSTSDQLSEITKSIDFTSQPQADKEDSDYDYEVVAAESCDDGEWVTVGVVQEEEETETEDSETLLGNTLETMYTLYDTMQSDGTTVEEILTTGSGDGLSTATTQQGSESTIEEGSGTLPTSVVTDDEEEIVETTQTFISHSASSSSTDSELSSTSEATSEVSITSEETTTSESSTTDSSTSDITTTESADLTTLDVGTTTEAMTTDDSTTEGSTSDISNTVDLSTTDITLIDISTTDVTLIETSTTDVTPISTIETDITTTDATTPDITTTENPTTPDITTTETVLPIKEEANEGTPPGRVIVEEIDTTTDIASSVTSTEETTAGSVITSETTLVASESTLGTETTIFTSTSEMPSSASESTDTSATITEPISTSEITSTSSATEANTNTETTTFTGSTDYDIFTSTTEWPTTHIMDIFKKQRMCKRKKILQCKETPYGCCWDNIHSAQGPFDKGCPTPKTCKESTYGCCPDGVSAALGPKNRGCPSSHCNETLFGCCWDKKTPAQGSDDEGCPEKPPACVDSKWGCCKDNVTEAKGPKNKGCEPDKEVTTEEEEPKYDVTPQISKDECDKTTYGCCPDGATALGPQFQGCQMPCSNSTYGCCPDQVSPAHGYTGEGCCLNSAFGCCEDNITPARGPNGDGCGCEASPYGCCPDKVTPAQGYNNAGCGCKYTEHGCCPDNNTPSTGLNFEGCPCYTFQFGCCPDGVSIAQGPHQQGCDCRSSEFGCCSDEKTPAKGPDGAGCTCDVSKHGCCLDGVTQAQGDDFEGCDDRPDDLQASCSLPKERGSCRNYTVKWHFDPGYGGCSRFWYGGCEGNDNRFKTKEECEGVCVKPLGIDRCNLPKSNGSCGGYFVQWYFDKQIRQCSQFVYGGCLGNNNRFETREECAALCSTESAADPCEQKVQEGPCRGQYSRYYFDKDVGECQRFAYGGCKGNSNNFATLEACQQRCAAPNKKRDYCTITKAEGSNCTSRQAKWYFEAQRQRCLPFYYTGCDGNKNSFDSRDACDKDCPKSIDTCHLPADIGECGNYVTRWYWDTRYKKCNQFYYGGCGGNGNNYYSQQECEQRCTVAEPEPEPTQPQFVPTQPPSQPPVGVPTSYRQPTLQEICSMVPDAGPCSMYEEHYYYDGVEGVCRNFTYGGCGGNYNNFADESICLQYCGSVKVAPSVGSPTQAPPEPQDRLCQEYPDPGNCTGDYSAFYYDRSTGKCQLFAYTGCGGNGNRFGNVESCERRCGEYRGQDICNMDKDIGICKAYFPKVYFDRQSGKCTQFVYGGCGGNGNRFDSVEECQHYCGAPSEPEPPVVTVAEVCQSPADQGSCPEASLKRWYFDNTQGECKLFIYSGCGGNHNNFKTFQSCLDYCKDYLPQTRAPEKDPVHRECTAKFEECTTLRCPYGIEAYVDENECNGCRCRDPCKEVDCPEGTKCSIDLNRNKTTAEDAEFIAICRENNKPGQCPYLSNTDSCETECKTDADCTLHLKCCSTNCGTICAEPQRPSELVTQPSYTVAPPVDMYYPPKIDVQIFEPEVSGLLGDQAILNCAVSGNPNPKITWSKDNIVFDGTQARYRIRLDQTLQIITLHKTDSGIYLCTADNSIGEPLQNQIRLDVVDTPAERPVSILNIEDSELRVDNIVTSFNSPASLNCYALGWPLPAVTWWKEEELIPLKNREFEVTKDYSLLIHTVQLHNLGVYTCQAYNGKGKAASWSVTVRARGPIYSTNPQDVAYLQYVVNPEPSTVLPVTHSYPIPRVQRPTPQPYVPPVYSTEPNMDLVDPNEIYPQVPPVSGGGYNRPDVYIVPVRANITTNEHLYPTGSNVQIRCDVYGYPAPQVQWYKDGVPLIPNDKISESDIHTLTIKSADKADSGRYQCEATNQYSKASSTLDITIEGMYIPPSCTDNPFFANCKLIVKAEYCNHKYYAKFCCRSCTEAGQLLMSVDDSKQSVLDTNSIL